MRNLIHLHWLWKAQGVEGLRGVSRAGVLCGKIVPRAEATAFLDDTTCPKCKEAAKKPPPLPQPENTDVKKRRAPLRYRMR